MKPLLFWLFCEPHIPKNKEWISLYNDRNHPFFILRNDTWIKKKKRV